MIGLEDRQALAHDIHTAHESGARLRSACEIVGIDLRTLQALEGLQWLGIGRRKARCGAPGASACAEPGRARAAVLCVANEPRFADVPPARIVPMLADEGVYITSESTFSRVLREHGQVTHRGRAKAPRATRAPTTHLATAARQVWCWDMT
jgi:putative transposase